MGPKKNARVAFRPSGDVGPEAEAHRSKPAGGGRGWTVAVDAKGTKRQKYGDSSKLVTLAIVIVALIRLGLRWYTKPKPMISCTPEQELVHVHGDFLPREEFETLKLCTLKHPKLHVASALGNEAFGKTQGFVVKFNEDGVSSFLHHPEYGECFGNVFEKLRLPETNAFVFNALLCELSDYEDWKSNKTSVGLHLDQTVGMRRRVSPISDFLAHQVNVLYIDVADDMVGGELEVWSYGKGDWRSLDLQRPEQSITPAINTMVAFRGDSFHQVKAYYTNRGSNKKRLSLVLEQYKIDSQYYENTIEWAEQHKSQHDDPILNS